VGSGVARPNRLVTGGTASALKRGAKTPTCVGGFPRLMLAELMV
jgi:hypothetical protein